MGEGGIGRAVRNKESRGGLLKCVSRPAGNELTGRTSRSILLDSQTQKKILTLDKLEAK